MDKKAYRVGRFTLEPFHKLIAAGRPIPIKPKALAILSVLAEADGAIVSKNDLMAAVWQNLVVEDNALQAHVAALRKVLGDDADLLCTVHGFGYRLLPTEKLSAEAIDRSSIPADVTMPASRKASTFSVSTAAFAIIALAGSAWLFGDSALPAQAKGPAQVAIQPFEQVGSKAETVRMSNDLSDVIAAELTDSRVIVASAADGKSRLPWAASPASSSEFLLGGRIRTDGTLINIHLQLTDAKEHVAVWSGTFQESIAARNTLFAKTAAVVARVSRWAVLGRTKQVRLDAESVAAFIAARESISGGPRAASALETENYKKVIGAAPEFALGHSGLAVGDAFLHRTDFENDAIRLEAHREAERALELDPHDGEAYIALELIESRWNWRQRETLLLKGANVDPEFEPLAMMEARLLWSVGRSHDALPWFRRAFNIDPLHVDNIFTFAVSLASEGHPAESNSTQEFMRLKWPDSTKTRDAQFWSNFLLGAMDPVLDIIADPKRWPMGMNQSSADIWRGALLASKSNNGAARVRAIQAIKDGASDGSLIRGEALLLLSMLGDIDGAFEQAQLYEPSDPRWGPFLFLGPTQPMRFDPRFIPLAARLGFAAYWRSTGEWPDYCSAPSLPYNCKAEVDKLAAKDPELKPTSGIHRLQATN